MKKYLYIFLSFYGIAIFGQSYPIALANDYALVYEFHGGLAKVKHENLWVFIDKTGKEIIPFQYNATFGEDRGTINYDPRYFYQGMAQVNNP